MLRSMKLLRLLIPLIACYATDSVAFDGRLFAQFTEQFEAMATIQDMTSAGKAAAGSWAVNVPTPIDYVGAYVRSNGLCNMRRNIPTCN